MITRAEKRKFRRETFREFLAEATDIAESFGDRQKAHGAWELIEQLESRIQKRKPRPR